MLSRVFKAFHYRDFRLLWFGACTSSIGTWMQQLAQAWLVLEISHSARLLGLDAFLANIPIFLFSLVGGVVADRMSRRHLLLGSQYVQMTSAFLLAGLLYFKVVQIPTSWRFRSCPARRNPSADPRTRRWCPCWSTRKICPTRFR